MAGRYGTDQLSFAILIVALALNIIAGLTGIVFISSLSAAILFIGIFRILSRNIERRRAENMLFLRHWNKVKNFFRRQVISCTKVRTSDSSSVPAARIISAYPRARERYTSPAPAAVSALSRKPNKT